MGVDDLNGRKRGCVEGFVVKERRCVVTAGCMGVHMHAISFLRQLIPATQFNALPCELLETVSKLQGIVTSLATNSQIVKLGGKVTDNPVF